MNNNKIGNFISLLRKEKGFTQQELGNKLYVTDKAVSKWERGLSLPDITILNELSNILDITVEEILNGERNKEINIEKEIERITNEIKKNQKKKIIKMTTIFIIILTYIILKNTYLGYNIHELTYSPYMTGDKQKAEPQNIKLGISKLSFNIENYDRSYSYKNLRSKVVVENEIKNYLKELEVITCNETIYYYNEEGNFSIIDYKIKNNLIYTTVRYQIVNDNYCNRVSK